MTKITRVEFLKRMPVGSKWHITKAWVPPRPDRSPNRTVHKHRATIMEMMTQAGTISRVDLASGDTYHADGAALEVHTPATELQNVALVDIGPAGIVRMEKVEKTYILRYEPGHV